MAFFTAATISRRGITPAVRRICRQATRSQQTGCSSVAESTIPTKKEAENLPPGNCYFARHLPWPREPSWGVRGRYISFLFYTFGRRHFNFHTAQTLRQKIGGCFFCMDTTDKKGPAEPPGNPGAPPVFLHKIPAKPADDTRDKESKLWRQGGGLCGEREKRLYSVLGGSFHPCGSEREAAAQKPRVLPST